MDTSASFQYFHPVLLSVVVVSELSTTIVILGEEDYAANQS